MGFLKKIGAWFGIAKDDVHEHDSRDVADEGHDGQPRPPQVRVKETGLPRRGFSVPAQVVLDRPQIGPVLTPSTSGDGGVQGLVWYAKRLGMDEDGDVADKFLDEVSSGDHHKATARFKPKHDIRPVKVKKQVLSSDGKIRHYVEHQGRLQTIFEEIYEALNFQLEDDSEVPSKAL